MQDMKKRLAVGSIWTAGVRILINLMGMASTIILARLLVPEDFGLVAIAAVVFAIIGAFTELSLAAALIQHPNPQREHFDTAWTLNVMRGGLVAVILLIAAHIVAAAYGDDRLVFIMYAFAGAALITGLGNPKMVEFHRRLSFQQELLVELAKKFVGLVVAVAIALAYKSYWAIVAGSVASQAVGLLLSYVIIPYLPRFCLDHWRNLFSFSSWLALSSGLNAINYRADQLAVGGILGTVPLGQYSVGDNLASLPVRESMAPLAQVLFPAFSQLQHDQAKLRSAYLRAQRLLAVVALPVGVGLALVAAPLVALVMGPKWASAALVIQVLSTIHALHAFSTPLTPMAMGMGRTRLIFIRDIITLFVRYPLIFAGLFTHGLIGLLLARCASGAFGIALDLYLARRLVGVPMLSQVVASWRALAATLIMSIVVWSVGHLGVDGSSFFEIGLLVVSGALSYGLATFALWQAVGRPEGPEREALEVLNYFRNRLARA